MKKTYKLPKSNYTDKKDEMNQGMAFVRKTFIRQWPRYYCIGERRRAGIILASGSS